MRQEKAGLRLMAILSLRNSSPTAVPSGPRNQAESPVGNTPRSGGHFSPGCAPADTWTKHSQPLAASVVTRRRRCPTPSPRLRCMIGLRKSPGDLVNTRASIRSRGCVDCKQGVSDEKPIQGSSLHRWTKRRSWRSQHRTGGRRGEDSNGSRMSHGDTNPHTHLGRKARSATGHLQGSARPTRDSLSHPEGRLGWLRRLPSTGNNAAVLRSCSVERAAEKPGHHRREEPTQRHRVHHRTGRWPSHAMVPKR